MNAIEKTIETAKADDAVRTAYENDQRATTAAVLAAPLRPVWVDTVIRFELPEGQPLYLARHEGSVSSITVTVTRFATSADDPDGDGAPYVRASGHLRPDDRRKSSYDVHLPEVVARALMGHALTV